jgi:hypothetical protein
MVWAMKVACCSMTVSSMEVPKPSLRISTPNSLAEAAAPYSLAQAMVMSKGRIWSVNQGRKNENLLDRGGTGGVKV